jgi:integrase
MSNTEIEKAANFNLQVIDQLSEKAKDYAAHNYSANTIATYQKAWQYFESWCQKHNFTALPTTAAILTLYITHLAESNYKTATIEQQIYAITKLHKLSKQPLGLNENFRLVWRGIRRNKGTAKKGKTPLLIRSLRELLELITTDTNMGIRDRALLSFGWASAMRRSEIVALNWGDVQTIDEGLLVTISKSKTDQYGAGQKIAIIKGRSPLTCPVTNLNKWRAISYATDDAPIFTAISKSDNVRETRLSDKDVARILKKWLNALGLDYTSFAGHSLRSGFITTAAKHSVPDHVIMKHSRHKSTKMLEVYIRDNSLVVDNSTSMVGL